MIQAPRTPIQLDYDSQPVTRIFYAADGTLSERAAKIELNQRMEIAEGPTPTPARQVLPAGPTDPAKTAPVSPTAQTAPATPSVSNDGKPHVNNTYALMREIARGGMGVIYEARHEDLGRTVALKIMRSAKFATSAEAGRFWAEAEAVARLDHPNIIPIYEVGEMYGQPFFTMKLADGGSLADRVGKGPLPAREAAQMIVKIARAVQHAHERGVLHRDLKPGNILLDAQGEPYLSDFGIAKCAGHDAGLTMPGDLVGTLAFLSPEQAHGDVNLTTGCDVWSLGVMLYQMLSGRFPFTAPSEVEVLQKIMHEEAAPLSGLSAPVGGTTASPVCGEGRKSGARAVHATAESPTEGFPKPASASPVRADETPAAGVQHPPTNSRVYVDRDLVTIVARCMEKEKAQRMPSAGYLADELERWLAGEPIRSRHVTPAERVWKWMRRYPYRVAAMLAVLVCVLAGTINSLVLWRQAQGANVRLNSVNDSLIHTNDDLTKALTLSTAMRLANESRLQMEEDPSLGVLLALASAETTRRMDGTLLPESVSALINGMQRLGGSDATASRGMEEGDAEYRLSTVRSARMLPSPDGRWLLTIDQVPAGVAAALFEAGLPLREKPVRQWMLQTAPHLDVSFASATWTPDSKQLLTTDNTGEVAAWDVLAGLEGLDLPRSDRPAATEVTLPPRRLLGVVPAPDLMRYTVEFLHDAKGWPNALVYVEGIRGDFFLEWRKLDLAAPAPLGEPVAVAEFGKARRHIINASASRRWVLLTEPFLKCTPVLCQTHDGGEKMAIKELPEPKCEIDVIAFSPDERWMAFGRVNGEVRLYDLQAGDLEAIARSGRTVTGQAPRRNALSFSPDGRWLAISGDESTVQILDLAEPQSATYLRIEGRSSSANVFSPDGEWFAAGSEDRVVCVWRLSELKQAPRPIRFCGLSAVPFEVKFSADMRVLSVRGAAGECRRWEFNGNSAGAIPVTSAGGGNSVRGMAVSPDGKWIAATGFSPPSDGPNAAESVIRLFQTGDPLKEYPLPGHNYPTGVAFSPDGHWLASTGRDAVVKVWELPALTAALEARRAPPAPLVLEGAETRQGYNRRIAFHPAGRLYCTSGDGVLFEWDLTATDVAKTVIRHELHSIRYILSDVAVSPDGRWLAVGRHGNDNGPAPGETQFGNMVLLFDVSDPARLAPREELRANFRDLGRLVFSPDSRWLAAGALNSSPQVWDMRAPKIGASVRLAPFTGQSVMGVAFSPSRATDGPWLALGDSNGAVYLWDWQSEPVNLRRLELADPVQSAEFLPDGRLVTGSRDARLRVWETDPTRLIELARRTVGRPLSAQEQTRFLRDDLVKRKSQ